MLIRIYKFVLNFGLYLIGLIRLLMVRISRILKILELMIFFMVILLFFLVVVIMEVINFGREVLNVIIVKLMVKFGILYFLVRVDVLLMS